MPDTIPAEDLSHFGKIRVSGKDAVSVLHNILTNDIKKLTPGQQCPAALLTHTGKIQLYMEVFRFEDYLILVLENLPAERGISLIDKYIITEEAQLEDVTPEYSFFQTFGPKPEKLLFPKSQTLSLNILSMEACEPFRIESGIPRYGTDMNENTILSETGLDKIAVSGTKGCYPGQEVVARIETYKGLTKKLCGFLLEGNEIPAAEAKIYAEGNKEPIGWITSAARCIADGKIRALGYLLKGWFEQNRISVNTSGEKFSAGRQI